MGLCDNLKAIIFVFDVRFWNIFKLFSLCLAHIENVSWLETFYPEDCFLFSVFVGFVLVSAGREDHDALLALLNESVELLPCVEPCHSRSIWPLEKNENQIVKRSSDERLSSTAPTCESHLN